MLKACYVYSSGAFFSSSLIYLNCVRALRDSIAFLPMKLSMSAWVTLCTSSIGSVTLLDLKLFASCSIFCSSSGEKLSPIISWERRFSVFSYLAALSKSVFTDASAAFNSIIYSFINSKGVGS